MNVIALIGLVKLARSQTAFSYSTISALSFRVVQDWNSSCHVASLWTWGGWNRLVKMGYNFPISLQPGPCRRKVESFPEASFIWFSTSRFPSKRGDRLKIFCSASQRDFPRWGRWDSDEFASRFSRENLGLTLAVHFISASRGDRRTDWRSVSRPSLARLGNGEIGRAE